MLSATRLVIFAVSVPEPVLALLSIVFTFGSILIGLAPVAMAVGIMALEIFVALLQAYVFTLLVSSFIGQIRTVEGH